MNAVLNLAAITCRVGSRRLLNDVSLQLLPGRLTVLVGPNGSGKSTLLGVASGLRASESGAVSYDGRPIRDWPPHRLAAKRAVMSQSSSVSFPFTVEDVVRIGCDTIGRGLDRAARHAIAREAMATADVLHLAGRTFTSLSGGEQQRSRFARTLAQLRAGATLESRQAILLDEPVAALDLKHQIFLLDATRDLVNGGAAALVVLHDLALARAYGDEVAILSEGRIVACGAPDTVLTRGRVRDIFGVDATASHGLLHWLSDG